MKGCVVSAMYGRHATVKTFFERLKLPVVMSVSTSEDSVFARAYTDKVIELENNPLGRKWNDTIKYAYDLGFDYFIMLGSDDWMTLPTYLFIKEQIKHYDLIGFQDIYFEQEGDCYYWGGYQDQRRGEPGGAGRTITRNGIEKLDFNLWENAGQRGLDGYFWSRSGHLNRKVFNLKKEGLYLADIKDGKGLTPLKSIQHIQKL